MTSQNVNWSGCCLYAETNRGVHERCCPWAHLLEEKVSPASSARSFHPFYLWRPTKRTLQIWLSTVVEVQECYSGLESKNLMLKNKLSEFLFQFFLWNIYKVFPILYGWPLPLVKLHRKLYCSHFGVLGQKKGWLNCNPKLFRERLG